MEYRQLGSSDLRVSEIALGSWLTIAGGIERSTAEAVVRRALDLGINFIDTANEYGRGAAESLLGDVLRSVDRSSYVLATKVFFPMSATDKGLSAPQIRKQLDASLQRLGVEHIDLYQCHRYDDETPLEETMGALTDAVRQGKVRHLGFSEWAPARGQGFPAVARQRHRTGRVLAPRSGRAHRQVQARPAAARRLAGRQRVDEHVHGRLHQRPCAGEGGAPAAGGRQGRPHPGP